jgi:hypothetical protein
MTYHHDSKWQSYSLQKSFDGYAQYLLRAFETQRTSPSVRLNANLIELNLTACSWMYERDRAIVFIGYSFGGRRIKKALIITAEGGSTHTNIADSTIATVFLGVPHEGSNALLHRIGSSVVFPFKPFGSRTDLLDLVEGSSDFDAYCIIASSGDTDQSTCLVSTNVCPNIFWVSSI